MRHAIARKKKQAGQQNKLLVTSSGKPKTKKKNNLFNHDDVEPIHHDGLIFTKIDLNQTHFKNKIAFGGEFTKNGALYAAQMIDHLVKIREEKQALGLAQEELDQVIKKETLEKMHASGTSDDRNNQLLILMALGLVTDLVEVYKVGAINLRVDTGLVYDEF